MKKPTKIISNTFIVPVLLLGTVILLSACGDKHVDQSSFSNKNKKASIITKTSITTQSSSSDKKNSNKILEKNEKEASKTTSTIEKSNKEEKDSNTNNSEQTPKTNTGPSGNISEETTSNVTQSNSSSDTSETKTPTIVNSLINGDYSVIAGTWINSRNESITITNDGKVTYLGDENNIYSLSSGRLQDDCYFTTIYNPNSEYDNATFILVPSGVSNPHIGGSTQSDSIVIGQSEDADYYPFFKE